MNRTSLNHISVLLRIFTLAFLLCLPAIASAVTDKEMDQARAIATKWYLRYANDGSGYLDQIKPTSMADLEKNLKAKEKENIKAFKAISVPADYASWDKKKLSDFWYGAFASKGLVEKARQGRTRTRRDIEAMTVAAPSAVTHKEEPAVAVASDNQQKASTDKDAIVANSGDKSVSDSKAAVNSDDIKPTDPELAKAEADAAAADLELEDEAITPKVENHTWIYVILLIVLIGIVIVLVVFASNVMKKNGMGQMPEGRPAFTPSQNNGEARDKLAATIAAKNDEINKLKGKIESLEAENNSLRKKLDNLSGTPTVLSSVASAITTGVASRKEAYEPSDESQNKSAKPREAELSRANTTSQGSVKSIYLGRANARGLFLRADRNLNIGNSFYRLETTDGCSGTFRVVNDPAVWDDALSRPREALSGACTGPDFDADTVGLERIVTESAGTAILEDGHWRAIRKAKIHFE